jgi:hypothetical protein
VIFPAVLFIKYVPLLSVPYAFTYPSSDKKVVLGRITPGIEVAGTEYFTEKLFVVPAGIM